MQKITIPMSDEYKLCKTKINDIFRSFSAGSLMTLQWSLDWMQFLVEKDIFAMIQLWVKLTNDANDVEKKKKLLTIFQIVRWGMVDYKSYQK